MSDEVALVTGAASGFGREVTIALAERGVRVVACDVDERGGALVAERAGVSFLPVDVADPDANRAAVATAVERFGGLDLAFLNAGVMTGGRPGGSFDVAGYRRAMAVNVDGVVFGVDAVLPALRARGGGAIVVTASLAGLTPMPMDPVYTAGKHAVVGLVRALAPALAPSGVRLNAVCPGFAGTPLIAAFQAGLDVPLIPVEHVTATVLELFDGDMTGECWFVQAGRPSEPFAFRGVPGPRMEHADGGRGV
jgi:NAD(P)-dependent dehydrogenase (short-subunit alcohol dehydrogenase family)